MGNNGNEKSALISRWLGGAKDVDRQQYHHLRFAAPMQPQYSDLRQFIADNSPSVSVVSYVEVLGYHRLTAEEKTHYEEFFAASTVLPLTQSVIEQAVQLRQTRKMSLGDSLIAATCLIHGLTLVTRNVGDFTWIPNLTLLNPFDLPEQQTGN